MTSGPVLGERRGMPDFDPEDAPSAMLDDRALEAMRSLLDGARAEAVYWKKRHDEIAAELKRYQDRARLMDERMRDIRAIADGRGVR